MLLEGCRGDDRLPVVRSKPGWNNGTSITEFTLYFLFVRRYPSASRFMFPWLGSLIATDSDD